MLVPYDNPVTTFEPSKDEQGIRADQPCMKYLSSRDYFAAFFVESLFSLLDVHEIGFTSKQAAPSSPHCMFE